MATKFEDLPEGCISEILSRTSPIDVCRMIVLPELFKSAADSDIVWERFLPVDYQDIISQSTTPWLSFPSKKQLYFSLCRHPILIDQGTKSFSLQTATGKKCYRVGARKLDIAWIDNPYYWTWISDPISRFEDVACLRNVSWFHIIGYIETRILSPSTTYVAYLVFKLEPNNHGFNQLFKSYVDVSELGFDSEISDANDHNQFKSVYFFRPRTRQGVPNTMITNQQLPRERVDGWKEIELGEFTTSGNDEDTRAKMQIKEVLILNSKSGIIVEGIEVRPR